MRLTYLVAGIPILGILALAAVFPGQILELFYGQTYLPFQDGMILMVGYYALWTLYWPLQAAFKAIRLTRPIFVANLLAITSMFSVGLIAVRRWGLYGAIGGQALNAAFVAGILWLTWLQAQRMGGFKSLPWRLGIQTETLGSSADAKRVEAQPGAGQAAVPTGRPAQPKDLQERQQDELEVEP
jgi:O-antigen/teichoic acid export membrane protein